MNFETLKKGDIIQGKFSEINYEFDGIIRDGEKIYIRIKSIGTENYYLIDYATAKHIFEEVRNENK